MASTPTYRLPASYFYLDKAAAAQYEENTGEEIVMKQIVNTTVGGALDAWVQHIWLTGSGAQQITAGEGRGFVGHTRLIPALQIEEQIKSAGLRADKDDTSEAVASILYKVTKAGALPIDDHVALVRFIQHEPSPKTAQTQQTEIVWTLKLTPSLEGNKVFPSSAAVIPFLQKAVSGALAQLAVTIDHV